MGQMHPWSSQGPPGKDDKEGQPNTSAKSNDGSRNTHTLARKLIAATDTVETRSVTPTPDRTVTPLPNAASVNPRYNSQSGYPYASGDATSYPVSSQAPLRNRATGNLNLPRTTTGVLIDELDTQKVPSQHLHPFPTIDQQPTGIGLHTQVHVIKRGQALLLIALLAMIILHVNSTGMAQIVGPQGWSYVLGGPGSADPNLLKNVGDQLNKPGAQTSHAQLTPQQYINLILQRMTPDQKLGQLMIAQFTGPSYSLDLSTMISQYGIGAILIFTANNNVVDKAQLKDLISQMQQHSTLPLAISIDQEGGNVDRLIKLDGARPSATELGATNDPTQATQAGITDASDLASYGINLNLAPVVDVTNIYNSQLYLRTFGNNADIVTQMAGAYLQGLQQSGKVFGTLKHFPGLGDVAEDPHKGVPVLTRSKSDLEAIDWAPYRQLLKQGNIHAIMVTHEIVEALDPNMPSSLSPKVVQGILRDEMGYQGVIMTDSLTMDALTAYYTEGPAAALAIQAGCDLLMGASSPADVATMVDGIKQAISAGNLSWQRIDDSVRRVLMMKYQLGLLPIPKS